MQGQEYFKIKGLNGKKELSGSIKVNGAKNAALKALASTLLFQGPVTLKNVPDIEDVGRMCDLLDDLGVDVIQKKNTVYCNPQTLANQHLSPEISRRLRASIVLTGPLLARNGKVSFPHPGGCVIGARPIDLFEEGFQKMGARVKERGEAYTITTGGKRLKGAELFFRNQSVTATETFMMAAVLAEGKTVLKNAAMEPEIVHLATFLNKNGAHIEGAGTPTITIRGRKNLLRSRISYSTPPDRIEAGSFLILGALAAKNLTITHCEPSHVESLIELLTESGVSIKTEKNKMHIKRNTKPNRQFTNPETVRTHEYPGFPTDLQAPFVVFLTQGSGEALVFETIFEGRLQYVEELRRMGADITMMDPHRVMVHGPSKLVARRLESPDLRAGLAFVISALVAKGTSLIHNVYNIDRGYARIEERLQGIGATIERKNAQ